MSKGSYHFEGFVLDAVDRRLSGEQGAIEISARYFDALALMLSEHGRLVTKQRFLDEVWRGIPVTDEALTQCIRTLRRQLGDDASRPRFIETVPKHGYRFIAPLSEAAAVEGEMTRTVAAPTGFHDPTPRHRVRVAVAGTIGGGAAGLLGGAIYGFSGVFDAASGGGGVSGILTMATVTMVIGLLGGASVALGVSLFSSSASRPGLRVVAGGAAGGLTVGAVAKILAIDAFALLLGRPPGQITGAAEGAVLGAMVGLGVWVAARTSRRFAWILTALLGASSGAAISLGGGRLMGGSLELLALQFPGSRLRMDHLGRWVGEPDFGPVSATVSAGLEGLLFCSFVVAALFWKSDGDRRAQT